MTELPPQLRQVRDFFFKQAQALSPERTYLHQRELVKNQTIFRLEDLRKHLNNPFLDLDFVQIIDRGQLVDLRAARCFKIVQRRQIKFINRLVLQQHLESGAACLLEGVDVLEPQVNLLAAALDRAHSCTFSNAVVFFSQRGTHCGGGGPNPAALNRVGHRLRVDGWPRPESNQRHTDFQSAALPTELLGLPERATIQRAETEREL